MLRRVPLFKSAVILMWLTSLMTSPRAVGAQDELPPLVFIPGKCGSQLEAKIDRRPEDMIHEHCPNQADWHRIWLDVYQFLWPGQIECMGENIRLYYNKSSGRAEYAPGTDFRVPGFGNTSTVEYIDDSWTAYMLGNVGSYFAEFKNRLEELGYVSGFNLRGAPYDFRFAPHSQDEHFTRIRGLVEETYELNGQKRVTILTHSMGGIFGLYFLHTVSQDWKDKYVRAFFPINAPWKGAVMVSNLYTSGYNYGYDLLDPDVVRTLQRTWETGVMLMPQPEAWGPNDILVQTPTKNYTAHNYDDYFRDVNYMQGKEMYDNIRHASYNMGHPGVDTYCVYSYELDTPEYLVFEEGEFPDGKASMVMGPGDGTVNLRSLEYCKHWLVEGGEDKIAAVKTFENVNHVDLLFNEEFVQFFTDMITVPGYVDGFNNI